VYAKPETIRVARDNESITSGNTFDVEFLAMMAGLNRLIAAGVSGEEMPQTFEELHMVLQSNRLGAVFQDNVARGCNGSAATPSWAYVSDI